MRSAETLWRPLCGRRTAVGRGRCSRTWCLHMEDGVLALTGSILLRDKAVREGTAALLRMRFPGMRLAEPKSDAAAGAALLALETLNTEKGENKNA